MSNVVVMLSESDAKWLDEFLQAEYKREGFRPHEPRKPEVQSVGAAVQDAITASVDDFTMPSQRQRVIAEKKGWDARAVKLSNFIGENPFFAKLDLEEQERLKEQCEIMWQYSELLGSRIAAYAG